MIKTKASWLKVRKLSLAVALAGAATASATEFNFGETSIQWDNTISYGVAWRTEAPDGSAVASGNGAAQGVSGADGSSYNYDDGTLNFGENEIYTNVFKYSTDLEINYKNYGGFFRARAFYDTELVDGERDFKELNDETIDAAGKGYDLLDAFVWADYDIGDTPITLRAGRQVISWGESTFIQGGINSINPVDAAAFRRPGAEVKDGLLPVNMLYTSIGISADVSLEAFYQLEWEKTRSDPCGTFFSTTDFAADGCGPVLLAGTVDERVLLALRDKEIEQGVPLSNRLSPATERLADEEARDDGQYGLAVRWYSEALGDTEFGAYYMNIHSRLPFINGVVTNYDTLGLISGTQGAAINSVADGSAEYDNRYPLYQMVYPEDQKIIGLSFASSTEGGASIGGEISYRPDAPIQWNAFELILGGLALPSSRLYQERLKELGGVNTTAGQPPHSNAKSLGGNTVKGYDEMDIWQAQTTIIKFFDQVMGADRLSVAAEVGATYVPDLPDLDDARFGRSGAFGLGDAVGVDAILEAASPGADACKTGYGATKSGANANTSNCTDDGYVDQLSGGIRVRAGMDYNNAFAGVNMTPNMSFAYDIGNGPEPGAQFIDERLVTSVGVNFVYQNQTQVSMSYTNFSGGDYNTAKDRDNIALSASYSF